jgi:uncharacterized protein (TIGR02001 family)
MNKAASCLVAGALAFSAPTVMAGDSPHEFSANVGLISDYLFRGISQTEGNPALQGGFDYAYTPVGFSAGVWASNVDFGNTDENLEIDFYGGFSGDLVNTGVDWEIGTIYYYYPGQEGSPDSDYVEVYGGLSYSFATAWEPSVGAKVYYSPDFFGETDDGVAVEGTLGMTLPIAGLGLSFLVGYQDVDDIGEYNYWNVGLSKSIGKFEFGLSYSDTSDTSDDWCGGGSDLCDSTVLFSVSSSF